MLSPDSGIASGRWRRSSLTERVMRLARNVGRGERLRGAQHDQVLERERHALRGPRAGETKPASISARIVLRGRRSSFSTSRTPYWCMAAMRYFLAALRAAASACCARLAACGFGARLRLGGAAPSSPGSRAALPSGR